MAWIDQALARAVEHHQAGRFSDAQSLYREILRQQPNHAAALHLLGMLASQVNRHDIAIPLLTRATQLDPNRAEVHNNLGVALGKVGRLEEAIACYRRAVALDPRDLEARKNLGLALATSGRMREAAASYRLALVLEPDDPEILNKLGTALKNVGELDEAVAYYRRALEVQPDCAEVYNDLGTALKDIGELDEAMVCFRRAVALKPDSSAIHSNLIFTFLFHPDYTEAAIADELDVWSRCHAEPLAGEIQPHLNERNATRRLRVGYVSPDFREHPVGAHVFTVLKSHDRDRFEVMGYSDVARPDEMTRRISGVCDVWRNTSQMSDEQLARQIREDRIDILVDCAVHSAGNRLAVLARKPAPVQVSYFGYPGSTGVRAIDWRVTDPHLEPPGSEGVYREQPARLPDTFWCYDPMAAERIGAPPSRDAGFVTFGCLNAFCKVNDRVLRMWAQVLRRIERSRLLMMAPEGSSRRRVVGLLEGEGIAADRIGLVAFGQRDQYLRLYHRIDVGLDTFPYNGHTTSLDALWMGVPVVTLVGGTIAGRAGLSQLSNLGLADELVAHTPEQFVKIAVGLARDPTRLAELRAGLRQRMESSPMMDAAAFTHNLESAYRQMWERWCGS